MNTELDLVRALGKIEGKLDTLTLMMTGHVEADSRQFAALDLKIGSVTRGQNWLLGLGAGIAAAISTAAAFLRS